MTQIQLFCVFADPETRKTHSSENLGFKNPEPDDMFSTNN